MIDVLPLENNFPSIYLSNIQSLYPKFDEICAFTAVATPHVLAFTESWLNDSVNNAQITIPFYCDPFRSDRNDGRRGGGVCVYVRRDTIAFVVSSIYSLFYFMNHFRDVDSF